MAKPIDRGNFHLFGVRCEDCGHFLERTPSGWLACPNGHGKLVQESDDDPQPDDDRWGSWFDDDPPTAA